MLQRKSSFSLLAVSILLFAVATGPSARADGTCTAFLGAKVKDVQNTKQSYKIELFIHREDTKLVTYSAGFLGPNTQDGSFAGRANQLFSDRQAGPQPFNINAADQLDLQLSATGVLHIHYKPWNFDTTWDLSCSGSILTKYLPGFGVVTLTFRDLFAPNPSGVLTNLNNNARTGDYFETSLNPSTVNAGSLKSFGKLNTWVVDGQIYAQPLYVRGLTLPDDTVHNVVYAATQKNFVYAFDTNSFAQLWSVNLGDPVPAGEVDCQNNISPFVGITSTPVINLQQSTIYIVAKSRELGHFSYRLHALDLATGKERTGSPIEIGGKVPGTGDGSINGLIEFKAQGQLNRPGLLLSNGTVYIAFGSHGDCNSYHGWVFGYDANTLSQVGAFITTPTGGQGGIWQAGRGLVADQAGNIYFMTGNGHVASNDAGVKTDFSESFVRLDPGVHPVDWWTVKHHACYNQWDLDMGSSGPLLFTSSTGDLSKNTIIGGGKDGHFYLLNSMDLGHDRWPALQDFLATEQPRFAGLYCRAAPAWDFSIHTNHIHGGPVLWDQSVYGAPTLIYNMGEDQPLKAFRVVSSGDGTQHVDPLWQFAVSKFKAPSESMPGGILSISHSDKPNSGLIWALHPFKDDANAHVVEGMLSVFDATPVPCSGGGCTPNALDLRLLWHSKMDPRDDVGLYAKFTPVTIADGRAYVASFGDPSTCGPYPKPTFAGFIKIPEDPKCPHPSWLLAYGVIDPPRPLWHWVDLSYAAQGAPKGVPDAAGNLFGYVFNAQGTQHVFYRSGNNRLNELYWDNQGWHWVDLSYVAKGAPSGKSIPDAAGNLFGYVFNSQGTQHVFYRSTNNRLNELYWDNKGWHWVDLSFAAQGAPPGGKVPDAASDLFGYAFEAQGTQHVFYRSGNNRLNELYWDNKGWHWVDLSYVAQGAPPGKSIPDAAGNLFGYVFNSQGTQHVFYRSTNNRLNELYWDNKGWHWVDLSFAAQGAPPGGKVPDAASDLFGYAFEAQGTQHVFYRSGNNRLNELYWDNKGWNWVDLSYVAQGAPPGGKVPDAASDLFGYAFEAQGTQHVFYRSGNNRLNELYWDN